MQNFSEALKYFEIAADQDITPAINAIGLMCDSALATHSTPATAPQAGAARSAVVGLDRGTAVSKCTAVTH